MYPAQNTIAYRREMEGGFDQTLVGVDERRSVIVQVGGALGDVGVVVGKIRVRAGDRLKGVGREIERTQIHGGRDQSGDWRCKESKWAGLYNGLPGGRACLPGSIPVTERDIWGSLGECNFFSSDFESAVTETAKTEQNVSRETWRTSRPSETCLRCYAIIPEAIPY